MKKVIVLGYVQKLLKERDFYRAVSTLLAALTVVLGILLVGAL